MKARNIIRKQNKSIYRLAEDSIQKKDRIVNAIVFVVVFSVAIFIMVQSNN